MSSSTVPDILDVVANDSASSVVDPLDNNLLSTNELSHQNIVSTLVYYVYNSTSKTYTDDVFDYSFDDKVSVVGATAGTGYSVDILIDGADELLFTGAVDGANLTPKAMALECGAFSVSQVVDLSAGPMSYARFLQLGGASQKKSAYLLTMTGKAWVRHLAQMNGDKSIAMVDIESGVAVLTNDVGIRARYVEIAGGAIHIDESLYYSGDMTLVQGSVVVARNEVAEYTGVFNDLGIVGGKGELEILGGGDFDVGVGAVVDVKTWLSKGNKVHETFDYIEGPLSFTGHFIVGADTEFTLHKAASLTVEKVANINGKGGVFDMADFDTTFDGDEMIDVIGKVAKNEGFYIGTTDVLELGEPTRFRGVIERLAVGSTLTATTKAVASGEIALAGVWDYVSDVQNAAHTETILTMKDIANDLTAHLVFAGAHVPGEYTTFYQIRGVTPSTIITVPTVP